MPCSLHKFLTCCLALAALAASASQPLRRLRTLTDAGGRSIVVKKAGNAQYSWYESGDGRRWTLDDRKVLAPLPAEMAVMQRAFDATTTDGIGILGVSGKGIVPSLGEIRIPVIMVAYADLDFQTGHDQEKLSRYLNEEGYSDEEWAQGSVADYFRLCSYGQFRPRFDVVAKVTLSKGYKHYGAHSGMLNDARVVDLVREAVALAQTQGADFAPYAGTDGKSPIISIIHAGPGEHEDFGDDSGDYVWAHYRIMNIPADETTFGSYIINNEVMRYFDDAGKVVSQPFTGIGTFCHEFGHALGLPDIYDTDGASNGDGETPGLWDIMDYQFMMDGYRPISYSAYERSLLGWLEIETAVQATYTLSPLDQQEAASQLRALRIINPLEPKEYFILENRQESAFYEPEKMGRGMLVWHIDYNSSSWNGNRVNCNAQLQRVQVVPADGEWQPVTDLEKCDEHQQYYTYAGDVFPGYEEVTVFDSHRASYHTGTFGETVKDIAVSDDGNVTCSIGRTTALPMTATPMEAATTYYRMDGRRMSETPQKGIWLQKGRVVVVP